MAAAFPTEIVDLDSHEMVPMHFWHREFGERTDELVRITEPLLSRIGENTFVRPDIAADDMAINEHNVWNHKGPDAPGAFDMARRADVLDVMGIQRQFVFPSMAISAMNLFSNASAHALFGFDPNEVDAKAVGRAGVAAHNDWVARIAEEIGTDKIRPVAIVLGDTVDDLMSEAKRLIESGVRALWIPTGIPPANTSPADRALDPFWALAAAANVPIMGHLGTEHGLISGQWHANVPAFVYGASASIEFPVEPFRAATMNLSNEAFLAAMTLGGVFERHPTLRFGVIESGAHWVGPLAERLDSWSGQFGTRLESTITMKPSAYLARNVRVTPFVFEDVALYLERWPELTDVYCYSSDYPHREGGRESARRFYDNIAHLGQDVVDRFFHGNGRYLLPD